MASICVFDFDGTIANTIPVTISILKKIAYDYNNIEVNDEFIEQLRDKSIPEMFKAFNISIIKLPFVARKTIAAMNKEIGRMKPIKGIKNLLTELKKQGKTLGIVSSNSSESIQKFLEVNSLEIFDFIYTNSKVFGKSSSLKKLFKEYNCGKDDIIYIGDEVRDVEAARKVGIKVISVTWGVNTKEKLKSCSPDFIVDEPREILKLFESKSL